MGRSPWIMWMGPKCNHRYSSKRETKGNLTTERRGGSSVTTKAEWNDVAISQGMLAAPSSQKSSGSRSPRGPQEGAQPF